jgi:hypothetical protein
MITESAVFQNGRMQKGEGRRAFQCRLPFYTYTADAHKDGYYRACINAAALLGTLSAGDKRLEHIYCHGHGRNEGCGVNHHN